MARFRAYTSDSSDDEPEVQPERAPAKSPKRIQHKDQDSDAESTGSSSSDMHEAELLATPSRRLKSAQAQLTEDEGSEDDEDQPRRVSRSTARLPSVGPRGDTTIIPWAQQIGVDARKMHVMQTSLFRVPEEAAALKALSQPTRTHLVIPQQPLNRKHSRDSDGDGLRFEPHERASFAHDIEPPVYRPTRKYARVDIAASAVTGGEGASIDAGLALGRSFRAGWGPGGTLVHLGQLCGPLSTSKTSANSSVITKTTIPIFSSTGASEAALASKLLQLHLSNSPIESDEDGVPFATPSPRLRFSALSSLFAVTDRSYEASLFRLCHALFDEIDLHLDHTITADIRNRVYALRRKAALSAWLEDTVMPTVDADIKGHLASTSSAVAFLLLTGNQVEAACNAAIDGGNVKLATLISQAGGDFDFRQDLKDQLQLWREQRIDVHIDENIRKIYALLAGIVDTMLEGSNGTGLEKCSDVDVVKGLDWKRIFGLYLWFAEPVDSTVAQAFQSYSQLLESPGARHVAKPEPWYRELSPSASNISPWRLPSDLPPDALFSLIRLYADPSCSLSQVLSPLSFGASPVDYTLSWHLYILMSRCMRVRDFADRGDAGVNEDIRDGDEDDDSDSLQDHPRFEGHSPSADLLANSYAFQLERLGMIQEALFVLLHIEGSVGREKAIKDLLSRSAGKLDEWSTRGVVGSLKIPQAWVNEAKAIYALSNGELYEAYELYSAAGLYGAAHDIACLDLAPDAVIRQDLDLLRSLFSRFTSHAVDGWHTRGKAYLDYAHIMTRLPELHSYLEHDAVPDASQLQEVDELARSVPKLIGILPDLLRDRSDARHNAALAEMISGLLSCVDRVRPLALLRLHIQPTHVDEAAKLRHIHSTAYGRFLNSIEVA